MGGKPNKARALGPPRCMASSWEWDGLGMKKELPWCADSSTACFAFIFAKALAAVRQNLAARGCFPSVPWSEGMMCSLHAVPTSPSKELQALDTTWMDGATFLSASDTAEGLPRALASTGAAVLDACLGEVAPQP